MLQSAEILASLSLGLCLGFVYDILRVPRGLFYPLMFLLDILFCIACAGGIFILGVCCGGGIRFYMPLACALGAAAYWLTFGKLLRPVLNKLESVLHKWLNALKNQGKKLLKNLKNIFSICKKRFRITKYSKDGKLGLGMSNFGVRKARRRGYYDENSRNPDIAEAYYPGPSDICSSEHIRAERGKRAGKRSSGAAATRSRKPRERK
ncbi:MAG: spore cortex biosynthesis protein YabQ [Oscillospiraceae bacterium]|nr:spore cortex biosynthesis protein YabQ [Oscillospiraceae bacterium]